ncbi:hypothetical protein BKP35_00770 [Anaerobacillus arseniciselenatis]|uniref:Uncharacterized protein n=1 Tax=Anaerobacillus arseniciselenatis TaxID=85682 RepID=A0A1S2LTN7_9BACI|nr:hypothetical protein [Anaerobacillus arseniciselenatis]OIJ15560.1 hypothetical protein BKP35_00770 [Anaerobacillus arseniciselenatis]
MARKIAFIGLRLLAIYILLQSLLHLARVANYYVLPLFYDSLMQYNANSVNAWFNLAPFFVLLMFSILLWIFAKKISSFLLLPDQESDQSDMQISATEIQSIAFSAIGLFLIVNTLPQLFSMIPEYIQIKDVANHLIDPRLKYGFWFGVIEKIVQLVLGIALFLGSRGLVGLVRKIRSL